MPGGFGSSPFGSGPYGFGTPTQAPLPAGQIYLNPQTGEIGTGRKIDPATRQYALDSAQRVDGQGTVAQLVYLAYATVQGSSILPGLGETFREVQTIGDSFEKDIEARARAPVQSLVDQGKLAIRRVVVQRSGDSGVSIQVLWTDLTTGFEGITAL